jgi:hypothetical protein
MLRKSGITASQCALGYRLASIMKDLCVDEGAFGHFVSEIYNQCKDIGLQSQYIAYNTKQILDLAGSIPFSQIPDYIQEKIIEKRKLEEVITKVAEAQLQAELTLQQAVNEKKTSLAELEQFSKLKVESDKLRICVEYIRRTVGIIQGVHERGYNVDTMTLLVSDWEASTAMQAKIQGRWGNY